METAIRVLVGAAVGALLGFALTRIRNPAARSWASTIFSILGGAVFGAGVMWALPGE